MINRLPIVGVMGSHEEEWEEYADPVGDLLARRGFNLLTGAGGGVMTAVARGFTMVKNRRGVAIGILPAPEFASPQLGTDEYPNTYIEIPIAAPLSMKAQSDAMPYSRNMVNIMTAQALIILPGAHGTKNEVSIGLRHDKPMLLFGPHSAFEGFPQEPLRGDNITHVKQFLSDVFGEHNNE